MSSAWTTSLWCALCESDAETVVLSCCCPCVQYGEIVEMLNGTGCCGACLLMCVCPACACIYHTDTRSTLRERYSIGGNGFEDWLATCCCPVCSLAQEGMTLKSQAAPRRQFMIV